MPAVILAYSATPLWALLPYTLCEDTVMVHVHCKLCDSLPLVSSLVVKREHCCGFTHNI